MFEKEAEELIQKNIKLNKTPRDTVYEAVEFGYNKANEWHYIKNQDFPNTKGNYLVCRSKSKYSILAFDGSFWITGVQDDPYDDIIAWKEIVLPKESE